MEYYYSLVSPGKLLHQVVRLSDFKPGRVDLVSEDQFIQCSALVMHEGKTFPAHKHIYKPGSSKVIAQESWHVIQGRVRCYFYDLDGHLIDEPILEAGDTSFTLEGGHTYEILTDDTKVLEYKTGPYQGQELDKVFL